MRAWRSRASPRRSCASSAMPARRKATSRSRSSRAQLIEERMSNTALTWPWAVEVQQNLDDAPEYVSGIRDLLQKSGLKGWQKDFDALLARAEGAQRMGAQHGAAACAQDESSAARDLCGQSEGITASRRIRAISCSARCSPTCRRVMRWTALARVIAAQKGYKSSNYRDVIRELKKNRVPADKVEPLYRAQLAQLEDTLAQAEHRYPAEAGRGDSSFHRMRKRPAARRRISTRRGSSATPASLRSSCCR